MQFELKRLEPVFINIGGAEYPMRLTNKAAKELQELWGVKYFKLFERFTGYGIELDDMMDFLHITLKSGGVKVTREDLDEIDIDASIIAHATNCIITLLDRTQKVESVIDETDEPDTGKKKK
ncbi:MAG: gene transfer agent family protein [Defluviitaleaceae bacterium]|nr:gene transfer agent family protein [Defluviitaleaceae bacterium]